MSSSCRKNARCGRSVSVASALVSAAEFPQPPSQRPHPAQRPLGRRPLHDEVAGEATPGGPVVARAAHLGIRPRLVVARADAGAASCGRARSRPPRRAPPPARPPRRRPSPGGTRARCAAASVRSRRSCRRRSRRACRTWPGCGSRQRPSRPCPDTCRAPAPRAPSPRRPTSRRAPAARAGPRRRRRASSPDRRRPRRAPASAAAALPRHRTPSAPRRPRPERRPGGSGRRAPTRRASSIRWRSAGGRASCTRAGARSRGGRPP